MRRLHDLWRRGRQAARNATPDAELLEQFVQHGDHAAFAELVDRLGPLVYGACRRLLPNPADVEDAFQATFLVLVRRADFLSGRPLGPWLHRVALLTARNFRRRTARATTQPLDQPNLPSSPPNLDATDAQLDIDAAVSALPEKYRAPVILCHLQGWTRRELAAHLGCPESTASSLVGRGMAKLRKRLAGRDPAIVLAVAGATAVPSGLSASAIRAAGLYRTNSLATAASPAVAELTEGVLRMFWMKKWAAGLVAVVAVIGLGFGLTVGPGPRAEAQAPKPSQSAPPADDLKTQREKLDQEIAAARERIKQLEDQKLQLKQIEMRKLYLRAIVKAHQALVEPYIGLWVRPPSGAVQFPGGRINLNDADASMKLLEELIRDRMGDGAGSEFAINEFYGKDKPVVEAHFYDVRSLQTYLTRAAKDPDAPKKLKLHIDKEYPAAKVKAVLDACKAAGFATIELASAPAGSGVPSDTTAPAVAKPAASASYVIEAPDVLQIQVTLKDGDKSIQLPGQAVAGPFAVRPDGTVSLGLHGSVKVAGLQPPAAANAIRTHLTGVLAARGQEVKADTLEVCLDVVGYNSKRYYVVVARPGKEEEVFVVRSGASETVLDALSGVAGLTEKLPGASLHLTRKGPDGQPDQVLPIDWLGIALQSDPKTNYQLQPGDRLYVELKK